MEGEAAVYCSTCASGSLARYSDLVWVKHGAYRWWPCQVVHPCHLPNNVSISISDFFLFRSAGLYFMPQVERVAHGDCQFPVRFLGTGQYAWTHHGRAFLFAEGDHAGGRFVRSSTNNLDPKFRAALEEAAQLWGEVEALKAARMVRALAAKGAVPPHWTKLRSNKVMEGALKRARLGEVEACRCAAGGGERPCGEGSKCMNRVTMVECSPAACPAAAAGDCGNLRFTKRQHVRTQVCCTTSLMQVVT